MKGFAMKKMIPVTGVIFLMLWVSGCGGNEKKEVLIQGKTMGTTYHIKVVTTEDTQILEQKIEECLKAVNQSMSTYIPDSEISRFNQMTDTDKPFSISKDFLRVMTVADSIYKLTDGAWDGTVHPLIALWGFSGELQPRVPAPDEIQAVMPRIGFHHIQISPDGYLKKKIPDVSLDLASIAKGYGVDQAAAVIEAHGITDFLVEIGGEVYGKGLRLDGQRWRVGINTPRTDSTVTEVYKVVELYNKALATSGDYRNFFETGGKRLSHILDPFTGHPVTNRVVSVSVIAQNCTFADGLATALMVMGHEKGLNLVNGLDHVECFIIVEDENGTLKDYYSKGFAPPS
jgi:thiamine biosynthesis lipoprotein